MTCPSPEDPQPLLDQPSILSASTPSLLPSAATGRAGPARREPKLLSPVFVGDDASLHLLVVLADADGEPGAQLAVVEGVHHAEDLALVEAQAVRRLFLVLEMCPDVEGVAHVRLHDPSID